MSLRAEPMRCEMQSGAGPHLGHGSTGRLTSETHGGSQRCALVTDSESHANGLIIESEENSVALTHSMPFRCTSAHGKPGPNVPSSREPFMLDQD